MKRTSVLTAALALCLLTARTQVLPFSRYTSRDGLLSNFLLALAVDSGGLLWIGSNEGLTSYDGTSFRNYTVADGLALSRVTCIIESRSQPGVLWVGTNGGGVSRFSGGRFQTFRLGRNPWTNIVESIAEDGSGRVWAGTTRGVFVLVDTAFVPFRAEEIRGDIPTMLRASDSTVWIVGSTSIHVCTNPKLPPRVLPLSLRKNELIETGCADGKGIEWLATSAGRVLLFENEGVRRTLSTGSGGHSFIALDKSGAVWIAAAQGLFLVEGVRDGRMNMVHYAGKNGLPPGMIAGTVDSEGDLWIACSSSGLAKLTNRNIRTYPVGVIPFAPNNATAAVDSGGHIWLCTERGIGEFREDSTGGWRKLIHPNETRKGEAAPWTVTFDRQNHLWVSLRDGSISEFAIKPGAGGFSSLTPLVHIRPGAQYPNAHPLFIRVDMEGLLWISLDGNLGIRVLDPDNNFSLVRKLTVENGLFDGSIRAFCEDRAGNIWLGGYSEGLGLIRAGEKRMGPVHRFGLADGLPNTSIRAIIETPDRRLWIGMRYGGLAYLSDSSFVPVSLKEGLLSTAVWCIAASEQGSIWVGTQMGVQSLVRATRVFQTVKEMTGSPVYGCGETGSHKFWYVSEAGLSVYDFEHDAPNTIPPPIVVSQFQVNGRDKPTSGILEISSDENNCTVEVAGVSLREEGELRYQYRLLGSNDNWQPPGKDRHFFFGALAPGSYALEIRAVKNSGVVSAHPATIRFVIVPPIWRRPWFVAAFSILLLTTIVIAVRLRLQRLLEIERIRSRIATDLHDDIGSGLTRIAILSDVVRRQVSAGEEGSSLPGDGTTVKESLEKVSETARELIENMSDVVWSIDPTHDSLERLVQRLRSFAYEMCEGRNIRLYFDVGEGVGEIRMSSEGMRSLLLLSKEALTNVARHSRASAASISFHRTGSSLAVVVSDNGVGLSAEKKNEGNGLANMRKRTEEAGGTFRLSSHVHEGTRVEATFPVRG
ncbi:MAG TPA: two-component regulator propeller domain-containing protein [Bacteroidota bacterium]|nr:two-component regulator propeller domain-containing protein [Bacteroidota bacterium]